MPLVEVAEGKWQDTKAFPGAKARAEAYKRSKEDQAQSLAAVPARSSTAPAKSVEELRQTVGRLEARLGTTARKTPGFPAPLKLDPRPAYYQPASVQNGEALAIGNWLHAVKQYNGTLTPAQKEQVRQVEERKSQHRNNFW